MIPSSTPTVVWFPPTATNTPMPPATMTPTPVLRPGLGAPLIRQALANLDDWDLPQSSLGNVTLAQGKMTFALHSPQFYLLSLRPSPSLGDFYAEVRVRLSLCANDDTYGLIFRANSSQDYYRLALNCRQEVHLDRIRNGKLVYLQTPTISADVPPGPPAETTLGIWAAGRELRVFINGHWQFTVTDPVFSQGSLGLFAKSGTNSDMTVVFSDLHVTQVTYVSPTPSPTPSKTPIPTSTRRP